MPELEAPRNGHETATAEPDREQHRPSAEDPHEAPESRPTLFQTVSEDLFSETARLQMSITRVLGSRLLGTLVPVDGGGPPGGRVKLTPVEVRILLPPLV